MRRKKHRVGLILRGERFDEEGRHRRKNGSERNERKAGDWHVEEVEGRVICASQAEGREQRRMQRMVAKDMLLRQSAKI